MWVCALDRLVPNRNRVVPMGRSRFRLAGLSLLVASSLLVAETPARAVTQEGQAWILTTARIALNNQFKLWLEIQPRIGSDGLSQLLLRPALGYQFTSSWALYQGYAWTPSFEPFKSENRSYQESLLDHRFGELRCVNRTRFEQRFIDGVRGVSLRARHMLRLTYPIDEARQWFAALSDEPFINLNDASNGPQSGFDQNRAYVGVRRQLSTAAALELGYLHQYVDKRSADDLSRNNAFLWLDLTF